jgi:hypothetical protein
VKTSVDGADLSTRIQGLFKVTDSIRFMQTSRRFVESQ